MGRRQEAGDTGGKDTPCTYCRCLMEYLSGFDENNDRNMAAQAPPRVPPCSPAPSYLCRFPFPTKQNTQLWVVCVSASSQRPRHQGSALMASSSKDASPHNAAVHARLIKFGTDLASGGKTGRPGLCGTIVLLGACTWQPTSSAFAPPLPHAACMLLLVALARGSWVGVGGTNTPGRPFRRLSLSWCPTMLGSSCCAHNHCWPCAACPTPCLPSGVAAAIAKTANSPFEVTKLILQTQPGR